MRRLILGQKSCKLKPVTFFPATRNPQPATRNPQPATRNPLLPLIFILLSGLPVVHGNDTTALVTEIAAGLDDARSIYVSTAGNLFVAETGRNRTLKLSSAGLRLDSLGRQGSGDYQFDGPVDVDATNELKIYVADYNNRRVQVYDRRFQYLATVRLPGHIREQNYTPTRLRVNRYGELFFYDEEEQYIYKFDSSSRFEQRFRARGDDGPFIPAYMTSIGDELFMADSRTNVVHIMDSGGTYHGFFGTSERLRGMGTDGEFIWTSDGNRINVYSTRGRLNNSYDLPDIGQIRDIAVFRGQVFLLTRHSIYMIEVY